MKKKLILSIIFIISLIPMLFPQYGGGAVRVSGIINLISPIGMVSVVLFWVGVWFKFKNADISRYLPYFGMVGIILSELNNLMTWNYPNKSFLEGISHCFENVFPMFYVGVIISIIIIFIYFFVEKKFLKNN